jgi:CTP synthase (UTP-ammonia lyase)
MKGLVGIVGDFNAGNHTHLATNRALEGVALPFEWVPTTDLDGDAEKRLAGYDGIWIAPASPYLSMDGALRAIRSARERGVPLVGT